jgi:hypothetical protein
LKVVGVPRTAIERAAAQGGYVTREQLLEIALSPSAVNRLIRNGDLIRAAEGVYQVLPSSEHIDLIRGAMLSLPNAVASHQSAAHLLDFPKLPALTPTVTVASHTTHRFRGVIVRRADDLDPSHITMTQQIRVTNVARTLFDLARLLRFREFDAIGEALIVANRLDVEQFEQVAGQLARRGKPGTRSAREFITIRFGAHPGATILERKGRAALAAAGLPDPIPQLPIPWDPSRRFDDAYPRQMLAVEWDSRTWHEQRGAMGTDRRRDREAAAHGWIVIRFTWDDVTERPHEVSETVATLLRERAHERSPDPNPANPGL